MMDVMMAAAPAAEAGFVSTVWDMTMKGGIIMIPLAICSLAAMTIVVERLVLTRRARVVPPTLLEALMGLRRDPKRALERCAGDQSPLAAVIGAAIRARNGMKAEQEKAVSDAGEREMRKLRQRMRVLSSLPQVATMLGLLGTVFGMIRTFTVVAASADSLGKTERLAQGIHEAWTATAAGLVVAIPAILAFQWLMARIDAAAGALDNAAALWLAGEEDGVVAAVPVVTPVVAAPLPAAAHAASNGELVPTAGV
ncbi:MAG: MotA/TolQ/ExbB proton channel family protein [Tepidisphaera sp.]